MHISDGLPKRLDGRGVGEGFLDFFNFAKPFTYFLSMVVISHLQHIA